MSIVSPHSLRGQTVLLAGGSSTFEELADGSDISSDELSTRIDEAVISLSRAVFARGGRIAFWHDPVLTPLIAQTALEYWVPPSAEGPSERSFEFATFGRSPVLVLGEPEEWEREWYDSCVRVGHLAFSVDQDWLRLEPSRIVCIGGDARVFERLEPLRNNQGNLRAFALPTTGGAAHDVVRELINVVADAESEIWSQIEIRRSEIVFSAPGSRDLDRGNIANELTEDDLVPQFRFAVYPLVMSRILDGSQEDRGGNPRSFAAR